MKKVRPKGIHIAGWYCRLLGYFDGKLKNFAIVNNEYKSRFTAKVLTNFNGYLSREVQSLSARTKSNLQTAQSLTDRRIELEKTPKSTTDLIENFRIDDEISHINKQLALIHSELNTEILNSKEKQLENTNKYEYLLCAYYSGLSKSGFDMNSCSQQINISDDIENNQAIQIYENNIGKYWESMERFIKGGN